MSTILQEADKIAGEDRSRDYGHPLENHQRIADLWNTYLGDRMDVPLYPREVAIMMILLKVAREMNSPKRDNLADIAGYVKCIDMMDEKEKAGREKLCEALAELSEAQENPVEVGQKWIPIGSDPRSVVHLEIINVTNGYATYRCGECAGQYSCEYLRKAYHNLEKVYGPPTVSESPVEVGQVWMTPGGIQFEITKVDGGAVVWKEKCFGTTGYMECEVLRSNYAKVSDPPPVSGSGKQHDSGNVGESAEVRAKSHPHYYYLATPYTSYTAGGLHSAYLVANIEAARFVRAGIPVFSPIAHSHSIADYGKIDKASHDIWMAADEPLLAASRGVIVCKLPGWDRSKGIEMEIEMAKKYGIPVYYMEPGVIPEIVNKECGK